MSQSLKIYAHRDNTIVTLGPKASDGSTQKFGPLAAGQYVEIEKGDYVDGAAIEVHCWDADDYEAWQAQLATSPPPQVP